MSEERSDETKRAERVWRRFVSLRALNDRAVALPGRGAASARRAVERTVSPRGEAVRSAAGRPFELCLPAAPLAQ